jgi:hypothetical protein
MDKQLSRDVASFEGDQRARRWVDVTPNGELVNITNDRIEYIVAYFYVACR